MRNSDDLLELDVNDELAWDPILDSSRIIVKAHDGRVTLTGTAPTYDSAIRASEDAWRVGGVREVDNEVLVGFAGETIADIDITEACAAALDAEHLVPKGSVTAVAINGWVNLSGRVRHHFERNAAKHAVRRVDGVLGVDNKIEISSEPIPSDIADRIKKAFRRNAIIGDSVIDVTNVAHTIYLDGSVGSGFEREEAEKTTWNAPGVTQVINRLVVAPQHTFR
jgi:osmotically-inducible protein OsmY